VAAAPGTRAKMMQWDTSDHNFLEERGAKLYLIAMIDDATSELTVRFSVAQRRIA